MYFSTFALAQVLGTFILAATVSFSGLEAKKIVRVALGKHQYAGNTLRQYAGSYQIDSNIPLTNYKNSYYYGDISVGTPGQIIRMNFDTGSSSDWITSSQYCKNDQFCQKCQHKSYNHTMSRTYREHGEEWALSYGDGTKVAGVSSKDTFEVGGLKVKNHLFGEATRVESYTADCEYYDGILGLGLPRHNEDVLSKQVLIQGMVQQGVLEDPVFAFYLTHAPLDSSWDSKLLPKEQRAELVLGDADPDHYTGPITYAPLVEREAWYIAVSEVRIGRHVTKRRLRALVDSGTSFVVLPHWVANGLYDDRFVPCNRVNELPKLSFKISGRTFILEPQDLIVEKDQDNICTVGVGLGNKIMLGDVFMRKYYSVFDMTNNRIGFAKAK